MLFSDLVKTDSSFEKALVALALHHREIARGSIVFAGQVNKSIGAPKGYQPVPGGKHGGFRKMVGKGYDYWYPSEQHAKEAAAHHTKEHGKAQKKLGKLLRKKGASQGAIEAHLDRIEAHEAHAKHSGSAHKSTGEAKAEKEPKAGAKEGKPEKEKKADVIPIERKKEETPQAKKYSEAVAKYNEAVIQYQEHRDKHGEDAKKTQAAKKDLVWWDHIADELEDEFTELKPEKVKKKEKKEKKAVAKSLSTFLDLVKGGPYIGPRGGKWADPQHKIPWKEDHHAEITEDDKHFQTGKSVTIPVTHRKQTTQHHGAKYGQDIEPAGRYVLHGHHGEPGTTKHAWGPEHDVTVTHDTTHFKNPLVIQHKGTGSEPGMWKRRLSDQHGGKTGKALSRAIAKDGHDGIVTVDSYERRGEKRHTVSEIVDLTSFHKALDTFSDLMKGGPYIGPRGGKWADPRHKIPWTEERKKTRLDKVLEFLKNRVRVSSTEGSYKRTRDGFELETGKDQAPMIERVLHKEPNIHHVQVVASGNNVKITGQFKKPEKKKATPKVKAAKKNEATSPTTAPVKEAEDLKGQAPESVTEAKATPDVEVEAESGFERMPEAVPVEPSLYSVGDQIDPKITLTDKGRALVMQTAIGLAGTAGFALRELAALGGTAAIEKVEGSRISLTPFGEKYGQVISSLTIRGFASLVPGEGGTARSYTLTKEGEEALSRVYAEEEYLQARAKAALAEPEPATAPEPKPEPVASLFDDDHPFAALLAELDEPEPAPETEPETESEAGFERMPLYEYGAQHRPVATSSTPDKNRPDDPMEHFGTHPDFKHGTVRYTEPLTPTQAHAMGLSRILSSDDIDGVVDAIAAEESDFAQAMLEEHDEEGGRISSLGMGVTQYIRDNALHVDSDMLIQRVADKLRESVSEDNFETMPDKSELKATVITSANFTQWFGNWQQGEGSKVIGKDGEPEEQWGEKPVKMFHGTPVGGFRSFSKEKDKGHNIFGKGFYFTADREIAEEYTQKDEAEALALRTHFERNGAKINTLTREEAARLLHEAGIELWQGHEDPSHFSKDLDAYKSKIWPHDSLGSEAASILHGVIQASDSWGNVDLDLFLERIENPEPLTSKENPHRFERNLEAGLAGDKKIRVFKKILSALNAQAMGEEAVPAGGTPSQVFEVYLNIRNPIDLDARVSREDFNDFAKIGVEDAIKRHHKWLEETKHRLVQEKQALTHGDDGHEILRGTYTPPSFPSGNKYNEGWKKQTADFDDNWRTESIRTSLREIYEREADEEKARGPGYWSGSFSLRLGEEIPPGFAIHRRYYRESYGEEETIGVTDTLVLDANYKDKKIRAKNKALRGRTNEFKEALEWAAASSPIANNTLDELRAENRERIAEIEEAATRQKQKLTKMSSGDAAPVIHGTYVDDFGYWDEFREATGGKDISDALTYDDYVALKRLNKERSKGSFFEGRQVLGALHVADHDDLTWNELHYMMTNTHKDDGLKNRFTEWANSRGHDGLHHTGGWNVGIKDHSVWIAFEPTQIKATDAETFDSTSDDMYKTYAQPYHGAGVREGTPGHYEYKYPGTQAPKPSLHDEKHVGGIKMLGPKGSWLFIHRSSKQPGMWQASFFDRPDPIPGRLVPDTQHKSLQEALAVAEKKGFQVDHVLRKGSFQLERMIDMVAGEPILTGDMRQAVTEDTVTEFLKANPCFTPLDPLAYKQNEN
jgi:hypothetical protein